MSDYRKSTFSNPSGNCVEVWMKSRHSYGVNECVEVTDTGDAVKVRDSKNPEGTVLSFTHSEWAAFILGVRSGEFDL